MLRIAAGVVCAVVLFLITWQGDVFFCERACDWHRPACTEVLYRPRRTGSRWTYVRRLLRTLWQLYPGFPRPVRKRALLIGISYTGKGGWRLKGTHSDVECLRQLLIEQYGFRPIDITVMTDKEDTPEHLFPTGKNIREQLSRLTRDCAPRDRFVFLYAGHAGQKPELLKFSEADGLDEFIVPVDAVKAGSDDINYSRCILDNDIKKLLINPLKPRCRFVAFLDACHSATLLDLAHDKCLYLDGWLGSVIAFLRWIFERLSYILGIPISNIDPLDAMENNAGSNGAFFYTIPMIERLYRSWRFCKGLCRRVFRPDDPWVICFSACKDHESAVEVEDVSMTKVIVRALESNAGRPSNFRLEELLSIARLMMAIDYARRWREHLCNKALKQLARRDPSIPWAADSARAIDPPQSIPISCLTVPFGSTRLFLFNNWRLLAVNPKEWSAPAKLQMTSNVPRFTNLERFWI